MNPLESSTHGQDDPRAPAILIGNANPELGQAIGTLCDAGVVPLTVRAFADGETTVRIEADLRGSHVCIVQPTSPPTNVHLMELALIADAAKGAGARTITALVPYFGYARQDVRRIPGEPLSARLAGRILAAAGVDRLVVLELHSPALESAFSMALTHVQADEVVVPALHKWTLDAPVIVSPDAGGVKRAQRYAAALGAPLATVTKARPHADAAQATQLLGAVKDRTCLIVDDMVSTGGTIESATRALLAAGAREVNAVFIHAIMAPGALQRLSNAGVTRIMTTNSVPMAQNDRVEVISVAPILARALQQHAYL